MVYSTPPPEADYLMGPLEINVNDAKNGTRFVNLTDYSCLATHLWVDGVKAPEGDTFMPGFMPSLFKIGPKTTAGYRPAGSIEQLQSQLKRTYSNLVPLQKDFQVGGGRNESGLIIEP